MKKYLPYLSIVVVFLGFLLFRLWLGYCVVMQCDILARGLYKTIPKIDHFMNSLHLPLLPSFSRNLIALEKNKQIENGQYMYANSGVLVSTNLVRGYIELTDVYGKPYTITIPELLELRDIADSLNIYHINDDGLVTTVEYGDMSKIGVGSIVNVYWRDSRSLDNFLISRLFNGNEDYVLQKGSIDRILILRNS